MRARTSSFKKDDSSAEGVKRLVCKTVLEFNSTIKETLLTRVLISAKYVIEQKI